MKCKSVWDAFITAGEAFVSHLRCDGQHLESGLLCKQRFCVDPTSREHNGLRFCVASSCTFRKVSVCVRHWRDERSLKLSLCKCLGDKVRGGGNAGSCECLTPRRETLPTSWQSGEKQDGWRMDGAKEGEVEGQPQPHVKCGTDIWTPPPPPPSLCSTLAPAATCSPHCVSVSDVCDLFLVF